MRIQVIVALVGGLMLVAIPLYLWRRPRPPQMEVTSITADAGVVEASTGDGSTQQAAQAAADGGGAAQGVTVDKAKITRCQKTGSAAPPPEQCDKQPFFEEALTKAVLENASCGPKLPKGGTISFALRVDYKQKRTILFAGKSGSLRRRQAADVIKCVSRSIPTPDWDALAHQHNMYLVAVIATYAPTEGSAP